jgi:ABC-type multidrug transport system fused ATPase/permease subunit
LNPPTLLSFYVRALRQVLVRSAGLALFVLASAMHALGHASVALIAGIFAMTLGSGGGLGWGGSTPLGADGPSASGLFLLTFLGLGAVCVKTAAGVYASYVQARLAGEVGSALRLRVLDGLLAVHAVAQPRHDDQGEAKDGHVGQEARGVAALTDHVREVETGLQLGLLGGARAVAQLTPLLAIQIWLAPRLAAAAILVFLPFAALLTRVRKAYKRATVRATAEGEALLEASDEAVRHADLWRTYGAGGKVRASVATLGRAMTARAARLEAAAAALSGGNEVLGALALVCAVGASRAGLLGPAAGGGTLVAFAIAFFLAYKPARELGEARLALTRAGAAFDALAPWLVAEAPVEGPASGREWPLASLELCDVCLARGKAEPITFKVGPGEIAVVQGPTGAGKTTLLRTLLGLEAPAGGEIRFASSSLPPDRAGPDARPFAWVPQDAPLLADTLAANVELGAEAVDPRDVLGRIGAAHLVDELDGARLVAGRRVSGGERQWIALARALATGLPVLLLDEPTSGLDAAAQARVLDAIASLRGRRSVVIVTHRPEPLAIADRVIHVG